MEYTSYLIFNGKLQEQKFITPFRTIECATLGRHFRDIYDPKSNTYHPVGDEAYITNIYQDTEDKECVRIVLNNVLWVTLEFLADYRIIDKEQK